MERAAHLQGPFYISLKFLIKIALIKEVFFLSLKGPRKGGFLHFSQKAGNLWKQTPISRALLSLSSGVSSKGALPPGFPHRAPSERDVPFLESFILLSKSPVYEPSSKFLSGAPMERDVHLHRQGKVSCFIGNEMEATRGLAREIGYKTEKFSRHVHSAALSLKYLEKKTRLPPNGFS